MIPPIPDDVFGRYLINMGIVTLNQVDEAFKAVDESNKKLTLGDVLVAQGILSAIMRENLEKKAFSVSMGGINQLGPYVIRNKLGEGGMGAVYIATDPQQKCEVALKILSARLSVNRTFISRFKHEAQLATILKHPNIVSAYGYGEEMGVHYYAMEYCDGFPLDVVQDRTSQLPWEQAVDITLQVARGLQHAHQHGVIHRDIKPGNIFLTKDGATKILDLGLSKNILEENKSFNTESGVALGTAHYISPEQARGDKVIDGRTDIYSLGATLYHLLTGETPFSGSTGPVIMMKHLNDQLPNPQDINDSIPEGVVTVIQRMMGKEPEDRYSDCAELIADLELVKAGKAPSAMLLAQGKSSVSMRVKNAQRRAAKKGVNAAAKHPSSPVERRTQTPRKTLLIVVGIAVIAVLTTIGLFLFNQNKEARKDTGAGAQAVQPNVKNGEPIAAIAPIALPLAEKIDAPERWKNGIDLLPLFDLEKDVLFGKWNRDGNNELIGDDTPNAGIKVPVNLSKEFDVLAEVVYQGGSSNVTFQVECSGYNVQCIVASDAVYIEHGTNKVGNKAGAVTGGYRSWQPYTFIVTVRNNQVRLYREGREIVAWAAKTGEEPHDGAGLAVRMFPYRTHLRLKQFRLLDVSGTTTFTRPDDPSAKKAAEKKRSAAEK